MMPPTLRRQKGVRLLAELDTMKRAKVFVGSTTSNVALLVKMLRGDHAFVDVGSEKRLEHLPGGESPMML
jgi:hypothetical protein